MVPPPPGRDAEVRREPARSATRTSTTSTSSREDWRGLWQALRDVVLYWVGRGVTVFRVDNPHTKPVPFWEWLIGEVRREHPEVDLPLRGLHAAGDDDGARQGRLRAELHVLHVEEHRWELLEFMASCSSGASTTGRTASRTRRTSSTSTSRQAGAPAFGARLVLAGTLSPSYGIYSGFEHCENVPVRPGSEEYLNSEKYELKKRELDGPLLPLVAKLNAARRENPALQWLDNAHHPRDRERAARSPILKRTAENTVV